ncbi:MAG: YgjV family protein [archaeon]
MNFILIQIFGFIGLFFIVLSFQKNKRSFTLISQFLASLFFIVHFIFLSALTGAAINGLTGLRAIVFNFREKRWINHWIVVSFFVILFWIAGLLTWQGYLSLLPPVSVTISSIALWSKNTKHIRLIFLPSRLPWIIYNFLVDSYAGLATEAFIVGSLIVAIIRFDVLGKKED